MYTTQESNSFKTHFVQKEENGKCERLIKVHKTLLTAKATVRNATIASFRPLQLVYSYTLAFPRYMVSEPRITSQTGLLLCQCGFD
jgi:hypothetical protein